MGTCKKIIIRVRIIMTIMYTNELCFLIIAAMLEVITDNAHVYKILEYLRQVC